jgi:hypothetical protein
MKYVITIIFSLSFVAISCETQTKNKPSIAFECNGSISDLKNLIGKEKKNYGKKCGKKISEGTENGRKMNKYIQSENDSYVRAVNIGTKKGKVELVSVSYVFKKDIFEDSTSNKPDSIYKSIEKKIENYYSWGKKKEIDEGVMSGKIFNKRTSNLEEYNDGYVLAARVRDKVTLMINEKENKANNAKSAHDTIIASIRIIQN